MTDHLERTEAVEKGLIRGGEVYRRLNYYKLKAKKKGVQKWAGNSQALSGKLVCLGSNEHIRCDCNDKIKEAM